MNITDAISRIHHMESEIERLQSQLEHACVAGAMERMKRQEVEGRLARIAELLSEAPADAGQERDDPQFSPEVLYRKLVEGRAPTEFNTVRATCKSTHFTNPDTGECVFCGEKEPTEGQ